MRGTPPAVREWMTRVPMDAEQCETVGEAMRLMQAYGIRHMPVMCGMSLQGLVSQRDILKARCEYGDKLESVPLEDICQDNVLQVNPLTPVNEVAAQMLEWQVGSAVIVDGDVMVGIFTTTDALRMIRDLFPSKPTRST